MRHGGNVWQGASPDLWLDFSANLRPEGPPAWVFDAMRGAVGEARYYPDRAMREARAGLAAYAGVAEDCVLPTAGGIAAIDAACRLSTGTVRMAQPTFGEYALRAAACGRAVGAFEFEALEPGDTAFVCNPNNPTGEARAREEVLRLAGIAREKGAQLVADEAFVDYCPECSVRDRAASDEGLIAVGSLTKALCVPGVRLGYLVARPEVVERAEKLLLPWSLSAFAVAVARELPKHLDLLRADCEENEMRRGRFAAGLNRLGAAVLPSRANFLLADFGRPMRVAAEALKRERILVRTCDSFGLPDSFWRLAVKTDAQNGRLLAALEGLKI